jgi:hypothetical protein
MFDPIHKHPKFPGVLPADIKIRHPFTRGRHVPPNYTARSVGIFDERKFPTILVRIVPFRSGHVPGQSAAGELLIRLEETPPPTGLNEAAIPEMLIATSFFFNSRRPAPLMLPPRRVRQLSEMTGVARNSKEIRTLHQIGTRLLGAAFSCGSYGAYSCPLPQLGNTYPDPPHRIFLPAASVRAMRRYAASIAFASYLTRCIGGS